MSKRAVYAETDNSRQARRARARRQRQHRQRDYRWVLGVAVIAVFVAAAAVLVGLSRGSSSSAGGGQVLNGAAPGFTLPAFASTWLTSDSGLFRSPNNRAPPTHVATQAG